jgi:hypothetical protein
MVMSNPEAPWREDIEALLPWHAAGTLARRDAERVERALAGDAELARQYAMVREELGETIRLNESLGAPSARAMERLMAAIDADAATTPRRAPLNIAARVAERLMRLRPRTLAWSAVAAVLAIVLQAALITGLAVETAQRNSGFETALFSDKVSPATGTFVLVGFTPQVTTADLTTFLAANKATIVDGPSSEGLYKIRVATTKLARDDLAAIVKRMQDDSRVIRFAAPTN